MRAEEKQNKKRKEKSRQLHKRKQTKRKKDRKKKKTSLLLILRNEQRTIPRQETLKEKYMKQRKPETGKKCWQTDGETPSSLGRPWSIKKLSPRVFSLLSALLHPSPSSGLFLPPAPPPTRHFCNICGLRSNFNSLGHHLQTFLLVLLLSSIRLPQAPL